MGQADVSRGLRERKKHATRLAIRREAFRLFERQGYAATTVEQIAEAAEVSQSTFYRYFSVKEAVLLSDDHTQPIVDAFIAAPPGLTPVAAYRHAVQQVFSGLTEDERENAVTGQRLLYTVPDARSLVYREYVRLIDLITDALRHRLPARTAEAERRVVAGAVVGVLIAASDGTPLPGEALEHALTVLDGRLS